MKAAKGKMWTSNEIKIMSLLYLKLTKDWREMLVEKRGGHKYCLSEMHLKSHVLYSLQCANMSSRATASRLPK